MLSLDVGWDVLGVYLENQVSVGLQGSSVGLALALGFGAAYACYYLTSIAKKPKLITGGKKFYEFLRDHCPVVTETYYPPFWCWESRAQTLLRPFVTAKPWVTYRNELIRAPDGGQISLDWFDNDSSSSHPDPPSRPTVLLLPGLTGTSRESYILHMVQQSRELGYRCVVFNNRGVSGEKLLTPRTYCAANTEDLEMVIEHVRKTNPAAPIMAAGVSMGGHRPVLEKNYDIDHVMKAKTIREFDERFTSIMFGYPTNDDYYRDASPIHKLKSVQVPMLCLNAADDVFSPSHAIPIEVVKQNPNLALLITCHGGHIGFLEGLWPRQSTYMDRVFRQFAKAVIEQGGRLNNLQ
ncbi:phospholipase ABHD3 isoform X2 [Hoplias malabaricus]|uniref:phospholipase ABHD3 isoform X2 n=1 Tax=Hoplias malabaricus TaxID=27720 RepID=UPI003462976A